MKTRNLSRTAEIVGGILILLIALMAFVALFGLIYFAAQFAAVSAQDAEFWSLSRIARRILYVGFLIGIVFVGLALLEGRQVCALYLRRFHLNVNAVSPTDRGGLGRRIRLFTLDDREFVPAEVPPLDKWLTRLVPFAALLLAIGIGKVTTDATLGEFSDTNDGNWLAMVFFFAFSAGMFTLILSMLLMHRYRLRRGATIYVKRAPDLDRAVAAVESASSWWTRPALLSRQATVIAVSDPLWRDTVQALAKKVDSIVIDVSEPTENILWELQLVQGANIHFALIADEDRWQQLPADKQLMAVRPDDRLFTYRPLDAAQLRSFRRNLAEFLVAASRPKTQRKMTWFFPIGKCVRVFAFYFVGFVISAAIAGLVGLLALGPAMLFVRR
jgi:hypothetical protein